MSGLFGKKTQGTTDKRLNAIEINSSAYGTPVPLVYGRRRIPLSLLWYGNFTATAHTERQPGGKGGGKGGGNTSFTYSAALALGMCEGPIYSLGNIFADKKQTDATALGFTVFTGAGGQTPWSYLTTNFPAEAIGYDHHAYIASPSFDLGGSAAMPNLSCVVSGLTMYSGGPAPFTYAEPSDIVIDYCTDANHGCNFGDLGTLQGVGATWQTYCIAMGFFLSPAELTQRKASEFLKELAEITNSAPVGSATKLTFVPYADAAVTGNGRTYTPNLTPLFSFTDDDFIAGDGEDPVIPRRKPESEVYNRIRVEYLDEANQWNPAIAEATDAAHIALYGERTKDTINFHSIGRASVARQVAQHILQRQLYVRNTYEFKVRADYSLLEPMDFVTITDAGLNLNAQLVRIIETDDSEEDVFAIVAEEVPVGVASPALYNWGAAQGYIANYAATPPSVQAPLIFVAPAMLVSGQGGYELWIATAGSAGSYGGCDVYVSLDNSSYAYAGTIAGAARYGTLRATLSSVADPDTTSTLQLQLADTSLSMGAATTTDADELRTLLYVDGEVMSYRDATLVGTGQYNLGYLRRAKYGSTQGSHATGTKWARIDAGLFRMPIDPGLVGKTIYFKFTSFNLYGQETQALSAATAYSYVIRPIAQPQYSGGFVLENVAIVGRTMTKSGGTDATFGDSQAYSIDGYSTGCFVAAQSGATNKEVLFGLNSDPTTDGSYTSIDFAYDFSADGNIRIYENGAFIGNYGAYTTSTLLAIAWDGGRVRYFKDGVILRETPALPPKLYFDSSFYNLGASLVNVSFDAIGVVPGSLVNGGALNRDPNFTDAAAWSNSYVVGTPYGNPYSIVALSDGVAGNLAARSGTPGSNGSGIFGLDRIAIDASKTYRVRGRARRSGTADGTLYMGVALYDSAGAMYAPAGSDGTFWSYGAASAATVPTTWTAYEFVFGAGTSKTFPGANERTMTPLALMNYGSTLGYIEVQDLRIEEVLPTSLIKSGAVSDSYQAYDAGPVTNNNSATETVLVSVTFTPAYDCAILATAFFERIATAGGGIGLECGLRFVQGGTSAQSAFLSPTTTRQPAAVSQIFTAVAGTSVTVKLNSSVFGGQSVDHYNSTLTVSVFKR